MNLPAKEKESEAVGLARQEWERILTAKKGLVEKRLGRPLLRAVTALVHTDDDKTLREELYTTQDPTGRGSPQQVSAKSFGILVHKLMEKGWEWEQSRLEKASRI